MQASRMAYWMPYFLIRFVAALASTAGEGLAENPHVVNCLEENQSGLPVLLLQVELR
jgi:hypothetical protein